MTSKHTILLAEDDEFLQKMYSKKFEREGMEVISAYDGAQALEALKNNKIDAALVDILMPKMDGFELLEKIEQTGEFSEIPIIVLTNLSNTEDIKFAKKHGAADFIVKANFLPSEVSEKIKKYINGKQT